MFMAAIRSNKGFVVLRLIVCVLIVKVTLGIFLSYSDYLPSPNFAADFLTDRESYFFGAYSWVFYVHIVAGPCTLLAGLLLMSDRFRIRFTKWHRRLGRLQVTCVLFVSISGLWMSRYAATGWIAGSGFALLSIATGSFVVLGFRSAIKRRFAEHKRWMWRCYLLLCSAVILRLTAGLAAVAGVEGAWTYQLAAWTSWLVPLVVYELNRMRHRRGRRPVGDLQPSRSQSAA